MKTKNLLITIFSALISCVFVACNGSSDNETKVTGETNTNVSQKSEPINISIVLDLSDRLTRTNVSPSQMYNDTAIINYFIDYFIEYSKKQDVNKCKNKFQILFYPSPSDGNINNLSRDLWVDLSKIPDKEKRPKLLEMKTKIDETLDVIFSKTLDAKKWEGSDIWDFFSNKQVDKLCIKKGYRNIVAILTDGYLYHVNHKINEDNAYSYVLPETLQKDGSLIVRRKDLNDVEIIMLEINPYNPNERDKLITVLKEWFINMGVDESNLSLNETDVENRTETIIENFLNN